MDDNRSLEDVLRLLASPSKSHARAIARSMLLTSTALDSLIANAADVGYIHQFCLRDTVPTHLTSGLVSLVDKNPSRLVNRLPQILRDRRRLAGHLFHTLDGAVWHLVYFDQRDTGYSVEANWAHGPHVHYLSHLWPEYSLQAIVDEFSSAKPHMRGSIHIRYAEDDRSGA